MSNLGRELRNKVRWLLSRRKRSLHTLLGKGMAVGTWKNLAWKRARRMRQIRNWCNSSRSRRGHIAKCVRALRWASVERALSLMRTSTAATHDGVSIRPPVAGSRPRRIWVVDTHRWERLSRIATVHLRPAIKKRQFGVKPQSLIL